MIYNQVVFNLTIKIKTHYNLNTMEKKNYKIYN